MRTRDFHGHPKYLELTEKELKLHSDKNRDYAGGGDPLGNFSRVANILGLYPGLDLSNPVTVAMVYALKHLDAVLWQLANDYEGAVDSIDERMADIHIYFKIARILHGEE